MRWPGSLVWMSCSRADTLTARSSSCVRWYLRFKLSYRDLVEMDGGARPVVGAHHDHAMGALLCSGVRTPLEPVRPASRVIMACRQNLREDRGKWANLYRAVDSAGQTVDFRLSARRDVGNQSVFPQGHQGSGIGSGDHYIGRLRGVAPRRARDENGQLPAKTRCGHQSTGTT